MLLIILVTPIAICNEQIQPSPPDNGFYLKKGDVVEYNITTAFSYPITNFMVSSILNNNESYRNFQYDLLKGMILKIWIIDKNTSLNGPFNMTGIYYKIECPVPEVGEVNSSIFSIFNDAYIIPNGFIVSLYSFLTPAFSSDQDAFSYFNQSFGATEVNQYNQIFNYTSKITTDNNNIYVQYSGSAINYSSNSLNYDWRTGLLQTYETKKIDNGTLLYDFRLETLNLTIPFNLLNFLLTNEYFYLIIGSSTIVLLTLVINYLRFKKSNKKKASVKDYTKYLLSKFSKEPKNANTQIEKQITLLEQIIDENSPK